ncbi:hypothetical protein DTO271G3_1395 [Paecilomyces variotii]|nr:hypothetical protein DTO271G3_1395 [Paecilomyces variotii]
MACKGGSDSTCPLFRSARSRQSPRRCGSPSRPLSQHRNLTSLTTLLLYSTLHILFCVSPFFASASHPHLTRCICCCCQQIDIFLNYCSTGLDTFPEGHTFDNGGEGDSFSPQSPGGRCSFWGERFRA